jgi:hypothetical protein
MSGAEGSPDILGRPNGYDAIAREKHGLITTQ